MKNGTTRARVNNVVDLLIAVAFVLVAVSGLVIFFSGSGGWQGGRNPGFGRQVLLLDRAAWRDLHDWSGIAMLAGVFLHLVLHTKWIACMTRNLFGGRTPRRDREDCPVEG